MTEYIEREAAIRVVNGQSSFTMTRNGLIDSISKLPAADVAPVVHGRWINAYTDIESNPLFMYGICSNCGFEQGLSDKLNYCPNCGTKMDGSKV